MEGVRPFKLLTPARRKKGLSFGRADRAQATTGQHHGMGRHGQAWPKSCRHVPGVWGGVAGMLGGALEQAGQALARPPMGMAHHRVSRASQSGSNLYGHLCCMHMPGAQGDGSAGAGVTRNKAGQVSHSFYGVYDSFGAQTRKDRSGQKESTAGSAAPGRSLAVLLLVRGPEPLVAATWGWG